MNYIVFDLEWNQCPYGKDRENKRLPFEIIEFGAVKLDENREVIDKFQQIVKPAVYHRLHYRTKEILNIDKNTLESGLSFSKSVRRFLRWCGEDVVFCTWGPTDLIELQRNLKYYTMLHFLEGPVRYYDLQKIFGIACEGKKNCRSLEYAIERQRVFTVHFMMPGIRRRCLQNCRLRWLRKITRLILIRIQNPKKKKFMSCLRIIQNIFQENFQQKKTQ